MDRLLRDNEEVVIMHDLSFLIRGMGIMENCHFSFYMSFLGRLYHLISRKGDFNSSGPNVVAWVGYHYGPSFFIRGSPNSLYKEEVWACTPGFVLWAYIYVVLYLISVAPQLLTKAGLGKG